MNRMTATAAVALTFVLLPSEIQSYVMFAAGVSANSKVPDAARQVIKFLTGPTAIPVIRAQGMEPAQHATND